MSQSLAKVYLHLIFSTKNRAPLLVDEWRDELFRILGGTANNLGCQSLLVGGMPDHIHMLFQLGRTISMSEAISKIKSTSSTWINQMYPSRDRFHWQAGYAVFSVSQSNIEAVRTYILNQKNFTPNSRFRMKSANGCDATKSNGMSDLSGIEAERPLQGRDPLTPFSQACGLG